MDGFVNSLKIITFMALLITIILLASKLDDKKERYLEPFNPPVPKQVQAASLVPITADMCNDWQMVHDTPGMQNWCRDIGMLTGTY